MAYAIISITDFKERDVLNLLIDISIKCQPIFIFFRKRIVAGLVREKFTFHWIFEDTLGGSLN